MKELSAMMYYPLFYKDKRTAESRNKGVCCYFIQFIPCDFIIQNIYPQKGRKNIDASFEFQSATIACPHTGNHRDRSKRLCVINQQSSILVRLPFFLPCGFRPSPSEVCIAKMQSHEGHPISEEYI